MTLIDTKAEDISLYDGFIVSILHSGYYLFVATKKVIFIYTLDDNNEIEFIAKLEGHTNLITKMVEANGILWSSSRDGTIRTWDIKSGECIEIFHNIHGESAVCLYYAGGNQLLSSGSDAVIRCWDIYTLKQNKEVPTNQDREITCMEIAVDTHHLWLGILNKSVSIWR